jgi:hypothetical protein
LVEATSFKLSELQKTEPLLYQYCRNLFESNVSKFPIGYQATSSGQVMMRPNFTWGEIAAVKVVDVVLSFIPVVGSSIGSGAQSAVKLAKRIHPKVKMDVIVSLIYEKMLFYYDSDRRSALWLAMSKVNQMRKQLRVEKPDDSISLSKGAQALMSLLSRTVSEKRLEKLSLQEEVATVDAANFV